MRFVGDQLGASVTQKFKLRLFEPVAINTRALPDATLSNAYTAKLKATSGSKPYAWALSSGTLPSGLDFNTNTAIITGMPTTTGTVTNLVFRVTDSLGGIATRTMSLTIE